MKPFKPQDYIWLIPVIASLSILIWALASGYLAHKAECQTKDTPECQAFK